jgi:hypothetical protein
MSRPGSQEIERGDHEHAALVALRHGDSERLSRGRLPEEARTEIRLGLAATTERNAWGHRPTWLRLEAQVLEQPDPAGARDRLEQALSLAVELGMHPEVAHCHLGLDKLYQRTAKRQEAHRHLTTATTMYREMDMRFWLEQAVVIVDGL